MYSDSDCGKINSFDVCVCVCVLVSALFDM